MVVVQNIIHSLTIVLRLELVLKVEFNQKSLSVSTQLYLVVRLIMPLLDLKAVPVVQSYCREVRVHFLVSTIVDGHGCPEIFVGVPGHHSWHPLALVATPVVSRLGREKVKKEEKVRKCHLVVLVELEDRAIAAAPPAVQVELELYVKYRPNGGDNLVDILGRYPDICKCRATVVMAVLSSTSLLTVFSLTLDHVLVDDGHRDS